MAPIATMTVRLSAQIAEFQSEFRNATKTAEQFASSFEGIATRASAIGTFIGNIAARIASSLASAFGQGVRDAIRLSSEFQNSLIGLGSVARAFGTDVDAAKDAARRLSSDGLLPLKDSATGLKNLLATGFSLDQSVQLMNAFKDAAAFGRAGALSFGDAIRTATEGVKNGNSILVDNAGITKNLSQILKEAGFSAQDLSRASSDAGVRLALFNGILKESAAFTGDAARLTQTYSGQVARLQTAYDTLLGTLGTAITQNATVARTIGAISDAILGLNTQLVRNRNAFNLVSDGVIFLVRAFASVVNAIDLIQTGFTGLQIASNRLFEAFANIGIAAFKFTERGENLLKFLDPINFKRHAAAADEARQAYVFLEGAAQGLRDASRDATARSIAFGNTLQGVRQDALTLARELEATRGKTVELGESARTTGRAVGNSLAQGTRQATAALKDLQAAIKDSLSGLKIGLPGTIPGIKVDLSKLLDFIPPKVPDLAGPIIQGFEGLKNLPGIKVDLSDLLPPPPPQTFFEKYFGGWVGAANTVIRGIADAFRDGFNGIGNFLKNFARQTAQDFISTMLSFVPGIGSALSQLARPIVDFFANLFDRNKGRDIIEDFIGSFGGNTAFRESLNRQLGPFNAEALFAQIARVGRNNAQQAQEAIDAVNAALKRAEEAWGNLASVVNDRSAIFGRAVDDMKGNISELALAIKEAVADGDTELANGLAGMQLTAREKIAALQPEFNRISDFALAAFSGLVQHGSSAVDALRELEPTLKILSDAMSTLGLTGNEAITKLLGIRDFVAANKDALDAIAADQALLTAFGDTGILTRDLFQSIASDIGAQFQKIIDNGGDMATALALSQPVLQRLWEAQQIYGNITDDTTRAILDQAEQQGLVGAHMQDVNKKILDVLLAIADALNAKIPASLRGTADAATEAARRIERDFSNIRIKPITIDIEYNDPGYSNHLNVPALAGGGVVTRPTLALVGEAGPEAVVPLSQLSSTSMMTAEPSQATVVLEMDGRSFGEALVPVIPGVVQRYRLVTNMR